MPSWPLQSHQVRHVGSVLARAAHSIFCYATVAGLARLVEQLVSDIVDDVEHYNAALPATCNLSLPQLSCRWDLKAPHSVHCSNQNMQNNISEQKYNEWSSHFAKQKCHLPVCTAWVPGPGLQRQSPLWPLTQQAMCRWTVHFSRSWRRWPSWRPSPHGGFRKEPAVCLFAVTYRNAILPSMACRPRFFHVVVYNIFNCHSVMTARVSSFGASCDIGSGLLAPHVTAWFAATRTELERVSAAALAAEQWRPPPPAQRSRMHSPTKQQAACHHTAALDEFAGALRTLIDTGAQVGRPCCAYNTVSHTCVHIHTQAPSNISMTLSGDGGAPAVRSTDGAHHQQGSAAPCCCPRGPRDGRGARG